MASNLCYLCSLKKPQKKFTKLGYIIQQCPRCQLQSLRFKKDYDSFVRQYYNEDFFTGKDTRAGYADYEGDYHAEKINMIRYLQRIKQFKRSGKLLDAGCATGLFMQLVKAYHFDPWGFDVSEYAVSIAKKRHPRRVKLGTVSEVNYPKQFFDVITMFDLIEHLHDPRQDLIHLKQFLKPDGILVINTGDAGSWLARIQQHNWHYYIPPQHLFFFSKDTLTRLLNQAGFQVLAIHHKGKWLSLRYFLNLAKQIHHHPLAKIFYPLVSRNPLGKIPLYLNLFDNIIVYARIA